MNAEYLTEKLLQRTTELYREYIDVKSWCQQMWSCGQACALFMDHGPNHSRKVLEYINVVLEKALKADAKLLTDVDLYLLNASAWLHDIGMQVEFKDPTFSTYSCDLSFDKQKDIRKNHAAHTETIIEALIGRVSFAREGSLIGTRAYNPAFRLLCGAHRGADINTIERRLLELNRDVKDNTKLIFLIGLLQFADAAHMSKDRVVGKSVETLYLSGHHTGDSHRALQQQYFNCLYIDDATVSVDSNATIHFKLTCSCSAQDDEVIIKNQMDVYWRKIQRSHADSITLLRRLRPNWKFAPDIGWGHPNAGKLPCPSNLYIGDEVLLAPSAHSSRTVAKLPEVQALPGRYRMPYRSIGGGFVGRTDALWNIHDSLSRANAAVIEGVGAVTGAGGIGKSQLAVEYAHRFATAYSGGIFWIDAAQGKTTLIKQLIEGSESKFRGFDKLSERDKLARLWKEMSRYGRVLIILDDFPKNESLRSWLPPSASICTLITTRRRDLNVACVSLDFLTEEESLALLNTSHRQFGPEAHELLQRLGGLPLALELARSYLNLRPEVTVEALLAEIDRVGEMHALSRFSLDYADELPTGHEKEVAATFQISWDLVSRVSQDVLRIMSLVESTPVPRDLLRVALGIEDSESIFNAPLGDAIRELNRISLIDLDKDGDPTIHSLIKAFVKCNVQERDPLCEKLPASLRRLISEAGNDHLKLKKIVPHAEYVFRLLTSENDPDAMSGDEAIGLTAPLVASALKLITTDSLQRARSSCTATISYLERVRDGALREWTSTLQTILLGAYLNRGNTYLTRPEGDLAAEDYSRAIELCRECEEQFGYIGMVAVAKSIAYANRAQIYLKNHSIGRGVADVESLLETERTTKEKLGSDWPMKDHRELAKSLGNLRADLDNRGELKKSLLVRELLVSIGESVLEDDWACLNALGVAYLQDQKWQEAEATFRKCEEEAKRSESNEGLVKSCNNLAISLRKQRKLDEAERVCMSAVELCSRIEEEAWECQCLGTLANILMDRGDHDREAEARDSIREIRARIGDRADENLVDV